MIKKTRKLIITYYTSDMAFATEKLCKTNNISGELISAPRKLSADCGISYAANIEDKQKLEEIFALNKIEYDKMTEMEV